MISEKKTAQTPSYSVSARSAKGSAFLITRQVVVQGSNFVGTIFLARFLSIEDYGFFGIVFFLFSFIMNFGDVGLSASLLRQKEEPSTKDYINVFTAQLILATLAATLFASLSPLICKAYKLPTSHSLYFILIAVSLIFTTLRVTPTAKLERHLEFKWLSVIEIIQAVIYNTLAALLAFYGHGPLSFTLALLVRVLLGSVLINLVSRMPLKLAFDFEIIKKHLAFGLPYQAGLFVNVLKDSISPVIIGLILGITQTGNVNMASTIAAFPVMFLFILNRLFLPAFSRSISNKKELQNLFTLSVRLSNAFVAPFALFIFIMMEPFTIHVFGEKWLATKELFYLLWPANLFVPTTLVCLGLINAFGYSKTVMKFNIFWMILTLGLSTPLVFLVGASGFGYANILVNISMILVFWKASSFVHCNFFKEVLLGWSPALLLLATPLLFGHLLHPVGKFDLILIFSFYFSGSSILTVILFRKKIKKLLTDSLVTHSPLFGSSFMQTDQK